MIAFATIVVLTVILVSFFACVRGVPVLPVLAAIGLGMLAFWVGADSGEKTGGGWVCTLGKRPYGDRCTEEARGIGVGSKQACEIYCLSPEEMQVTASGISNFFDARGLVFPVPAQFLERISIGDLRTPYHHYVRKRAWGRTVALVGLDSTIESRLCRLVLSESLGTRFGVLARTTLATMSKEDLELSLASDGPRTESSPSPSHDLAAKLADWTRQAEDKGTVTVRDLDDLLDGRDPLREIYARATERATELVPVIDFVDISVNAGGESHANIAIINHKLRRVFWFEPYVGAGGLPEDDRTLAEFSAPLKAQGYSLVHTEKCPYRGLQEMTGDIACASWSLLGALLFGLNPGAVDLISVLDYLVGLGAQVRDVLTLFLFWVDVVYKEKIMVDVEYRQKMEDQNIHELEKASEQLDSWISAIGAVADDPTLRPETRALADEATRIGQNISNVIRQAQKLPASERNEVQYRLPDDILGFLKKVKALPRKLMKPFPSLKAAGDILTTALKMEFDVGTYGTRIYGEHAAAKKRGECTII